LNDVADKKDYAFHFFSLEKFEFNKKIINYSIVIYLEYIVNMRISDFDYNLPESSIAKNPIKPRDKSRLLVLDKKSGEINHKIFCDITDFLKQGDLLVLNNSKVYPARLRGRKEKTGGEVEVFLLKNIEGAVWECLVGGKKMKAGLKIEFDKNFSCYLKEARDNTWLVEFNLKGDSLMKKVQKIGEVPLPPYIKRKSNGAKERKEDKKNYQTIFASDNKLGSVAAPTAGLHFTKKLLKKIKNKGIKIDYITLHVGMGTFAPVKVDDPKKHKMHSEWVEIKKEVVDKINKTKKNGGRVIAVGTTTTRSLEALVDITNHKARIVNQNTWVDIFIYPGYKFRVVDAMITNFHLPKSTLLMLVSAFASKKNIDKAYKEAIENNYRFYSYGDAMFIK